MKDKYSIYIMYPDSSIYYTGKVIGDTFYRNFKFNNTVLWSDREFGLNIEIFDYLKKKGVKYIMYVDTARAGHCFKIAIDKFDELKIEKEYSFGRQYFVKVGAASEVTREPKLPYISKKIVIQSIGKEA